MKVIMMAKAYSHSWFLNPSGLQPLVIEDSSVTFLEGCSARRDQEQGGFQAQIRPIRVPRSLGWATDRRKSGVPVVSRSSKWLHRTTRFSQFLLPGRYYIILLQDYIGLLQEQCLSRSKELFPVQLQD